MAIAALNSAATGLRALSTQIDVIANNLSNAETTGFKGSRVNFEDLMYQTLKQPGATNAAGDVAPSGIFVGLGTQISNTELDLTQGSPDQTNREEDVAIQGAGFFRVKVLSTLGDGTAYTRNGNFQVNNNGELVVGSGDGYRLDPSITLPKNTTDIQITQDGVITATVAGKTQPTKVGNLELTNFINPQGLNVIGGGLYQETASSGQPITGTPGENGTGTILQSYLEESNVDPVKELVTLIKTQRSFELNSQSIQTADQALQTIANLKRS
jgi:flagellar basal-body rod protein FlgG